MNDPKHRKLSPPETLGDERISHLLELAGPRSEADPDRMARVRNAVAVQWRQTVGRRRRARWAWSAAAVAASLMLAFGASLTVWTAPPDPVAAESVGTLERVFGSAQMSENGHFMPATIAMPISTVSTLESGPDGRLAIRLTTGHSVRLDVDSTLRFDSPTRLVLERGAVYVSSDQASEPVVVATPLGLVHEIGTQFEVRLREEAIRIRVRDGAVSLDGPDGAIEASAGAQIEVARDGQVARSVVDRHDTDWSWILDVSPIFDLEGRHLDELLAWVRSETGWVVTFDEVAIARDAPGIELHGSIENLTPVQALVAVLPTCGLAHRIDGGLLIVSRRQT